MALPNAVSYDRGTKDTSIPISQEKPLEIGDKIWMNNPNETKGIAMVLREGMSSAVKNHIFGHLEDVPFANWVQYTGNDSDGAGVDESSQQATGIILRTGDGARVTTGSRIKWIRTREITRLTAVMSTDTTGAVTRNFGIGAATDLLQVGDFGLIIPPGFEQGFTTGAGQTNPMVYKSFATTEISYPLQIANIEAAELSRGGDPFERALGKAWKQAKEQMEGEMYLGGKAVTTVSSVPITASEGLQNYISTHVYTATSLSRMDLWDILLEWRLTNKRGGSIHCSGAFLVQVTLWAMALLQMNQDAEKDGMSITQILGPGGIGLIDMIDIDLFDQSPLLAGTMFMIPTGQIEYHWLDHYENLNIRYNPISRDEVHAKEGEIYGVYGWEFYEEEMFATVSGLHFAA